MSQITAAGEHSSPAPQHVRIEPVRDGQTARRIVPTDALAAAPLDEVLAWLASERRWLDSELAGNGALLFRGFAALNSSEAFAKFASTVSPRFHDYVGGISPRRKVTGNVVTSTELPGWLPLSLHQEMAYTSDFPSKILFFCAVAPREGGRTPICDMRRVYARLDPGVRERFERKQLRFVQRYPKHGGRRLKSWPEVFGTADPSAVERIAQERGWTIRWRRGERMDLTREVRPAAINHPHTGARVWFNHAHGLHPSGAGADLRAIGRPVMARICDWVPPLLSALGSNKIIWTSMVHGDGSPLRADDLRAIREALHAETIEFDWREGDTLVLDNVLFAHGRTPFRGPRRILSALLCD